MKYELKLKRKSENKLTLPAFYGHGDLVVLFLDDDKGIVVSTNDPSTYKIGQYRTDWVDRNAFSHWTRLPAGTELTLVQE